MKLDCTDGHPWIGRDASGDVLAHAPWMIQWAPGNKIPLINLTSQRAIRISTDAFENVQEVTDPTEYDRHLATYWAWHTKRLARIRLQEEAEAHRTAQSAKEDAQRRQAEEEARARRLSEAAASEHKELLWRAARAEKEEAFRRYRVADLQHEKCSFHEFRPDNGGKRALLFLETAQNPAFTTRYFFDLGAVEIVSLSGGSLGPAVRHGKRFHNAIRCLHAWQGELRKTEAERVRTEAERLRISRLHLSDVQIRTMLLPDVQCRLPAPELTEQDIRLVIEWFDKIPPEQAGPNEGFDKLYNQLLSARAAERAAAAFYEHCGCTVNDISITQIDRSRDGSWGKFDLLVSGYPVDVKSARQPHRANGKAGVNFYSEPRVAEFKQHENEAVVVAGMLSPFTHAGVLHDLSEWAVDTCFTYLGEITKEGFDHLVRDFQDDFLMGIGKRANQEGYFLPAWIFDLPESAYTARDKERRLWQENLSTLESWSTVHERYRVQLSLALGRELPRDHTGRSAERWEYDFYQFLHARQAATALPRLWLTVLRHFLEVVHGFMTVSENYSPARYAGMLYTDPQNRFTPLGIVDPLRTVHNLIEVLSRLWPARELVRSYSNFRLVSEGILQARIETTGEFWTLLAYCGGCGEDPVLVGEAKHCQQHRRLICPKCGYCSHKCSHAASSSLAAQPLLAGDKGHAILSE